MRTDLRYIVLDDHGWAQHEGPRWRPRANARGANTRSGLPWTAAEDAMLLERCAQAASIGYADPTIKAAVVAHGRSTCAITTRLCSLRAGVRLAEAAKAASALAFRRFSDDDSDPGRPR